MEEQMIFGALQTLNEEAYEDVLEEQSKNQRAVNLYHDEGWFFERERKLDFHG